ncbi:3348_t:CDS:2 [Acaulospora morrowiae]|uniref:3348_t:CDS:1 n=1 Tax=Acaulospora morrowiae TaxID=94023 RepID=A0A9N8WLE9_9GLOM|nr:3348_t:CDS:2 [Acaulospora morrowiae]
MTDNTYTPDDPYSDPDVPYTPYPDNPHYLADIQRISQDDVFRKLNTNLSIISMTGGLIVLLMITAMWFYDKKLVNRVSLRLTAMISFVDILTGAVVIAYAHYPASNSTACTFIGFAMSFFPEVYLFLTVMIAFNLQVVFLHRRKVSSFSDRWYIPVAILSAGIINLPPLLYNRFGFDADGLECLYRDAQSVATQWWKVGTFLIPLALSMIYCTLVLATVVCKLIFEHRKLAGAIHTQSRATLSAKARKQKILLLKLVSRISLYAAIPLINISGIIVEYVYNSFNRDKKAPLPLTYWAIIGSCLPGFINCLAFLFDPAIHNALRKMKKDLLDTYGYEKCHFDSRFTASLNSPLTPSEAFFPNSPSFNPHSLSPYSPYLTTFPSSPTSLYPPSPTRLPGQTRVSTDHDNSGVTKNNYSTLNSKKERPILKWFVRTFLDKRKLPKVQNGLSTSLGSDQGGRYSSATVNSGTISGQSFGHDYRNGETHVHMYDIYADAADKRRKTFAKRLSRVLNTPTKDSFDPSDLFITTTTETETVITSNSPTESQDFEANTESSYNDRSRLVYETGRGSFLFPPMSGNTTINIHLHQYPSVTTLGHIEAGASSTSFSRNRLLRQQERQKQQQQQKHKKSDSTSSTASRDSVDNELSAY